MNQSHHSGMIAPAAYAASLILSIVALTGMYLLPAEEKDTSLMLTPNTFVSAPGETFTVQIDTTSDTPVNAFKGSIVFNEETLAVQSIDYNTSLADLWAEAPWYQSGAGIIEFAGGSTVPGGFTGTDTLLTITFTALKPGNGNLVLRNTQILMHDGRGTEAMLTNYIDTLFTVSAPEAERVTHEVRSGAEVLVLSEMPNPDLNSDGLVTITDVSLFLLLLPTGNTTGDFNGDGRVGTADLSILLQARSN